jgi:hypothetical protein
VLTAFGQTDLFPLNYSVFQGATLSPKLFTLFIEDLVSILNKHGVSSVKIGKGDIDILLYADDMIVVGYNSFDLQQKTDVLVEYFIKNDLTVNLSKTKIVIFHVGKTNFIKPKLFWGEHETEIVDNYTYLGVPFHSNMNYARTADHFISKGKCAERELFSLFYRANIHNLDSRLALFESLVKSVVMHCYHIWGVNFIEQLKRFSMGFLRRLFRLPLYTPRWFLLLESSCKRVELSLVKNILSFWLKIMQKPRDSLMYYCYEFLLSRKEDNRMKFNWCRDVMVVLEEYECISFAQEEIDVFDKPQCLIFKCHVSKCLTDINNRYTQTVIQDTKKL